MWGAWRPPDPSLVMRPSPWTQEAAPGALLGRSASLVSQSPAPRLLGRAGPLSAPRPQARLLKAHFWWCLGPWGAALVLGSPAHCPQLRAVV